MKERYAPTLRAAFPDVRLSAADLYLLEAGQIAYLHERELAHVLHAHPELYHHLVIKNAAFEQIGKRLCAEFPPATDDPELKRSEDELVWEIGDLLVYNKRPDLYDKHAVRGWSLDEVTSLVSLAGKTVVEPGAGTGNVALEVARTAAVVYAVEPVGAMRRYLKEKARRAGLENLYVVDGSLDDIPFPADTADVLLTHRAIGWRLEQELPEIERIVRRGGWAMHFTGYPENDSNPIHETITAAPWSYKADLYTDGGQPSMKYTRQF